MANVFHICEAAGNIFIKMVVAASKMNANNYRVNQNE